MFSIIIPTVISLLQPGNPTGVHTACLQQLLQIGSESPVHFKAVVAQLPPDLKEKLETSVRQSASPAGGSSQARQTQATSSTTSSPQKPQQPTIQLKMSFANFS